MQNEGSGVFKPVSYFSRATYEQKYHSYELEALAVVESLERFKYYLLNKHFKVVTDCSSLKLTQGKKDIIPRIARWWLRLLEFDFKMTYRPASKLNHADALSRVPNEIEKGPETVAAKMFIVGTEMEDWISTLQDQDSKLTEIKEVISDIQTKHSEKNVIKKNFVFRENRVYKKTVVRFCKDRK